MSQENAAENEGGRVPGEVTVESLARQAGWVPPEEYQGREGRDPVTASEFLMKGLEIRGKMKNRLLNMEGKLSEMSEAMNLLKSHYEKKTKAEIARARKEIMEERDQAIELADKAAVHDADKRLKELEDQEVEATPAKKGTTETFKEWKEDNDWYGSNKAMTVVAEQAGHDFYKEHPNASEKEMLEHAAKTVRDEFPHKFKDKKDDSEEENRAAADPVAGAKRGGGSKKKYTVSDLSPEQKIVIKNMIAAGSPITTEEYINDLVSMGELK